MIQRPRLTKEVARAAKADAVRYDLRDAANGIAGLRLTVFPSGIKTWSLRYDVAGQDRRFTIGPYSENGISLDKARKLAAAELIRVKSGHDPAKEKAEARRKSAAGDRSGRTIHHGMERMAKRAKAEVAKQERLALIYSRPCAEALYKRAWTEVEQAQAE